MKVPCKGCTNRFAECHSFCEGYKQFRSELDKKNDKIKRAKYVESISTSYQIEQIIKGTRGHCRNV